MWGWGGEEGAGFKRNSGVLKILCASWLYGSLYEKRRELTLGNVAVNALLKQAALLSCKIR